MDLIRRQANILDYETKKSETEWRTKQYMHKYTQTIFRTTHKTTALTGTIEFSDALRTFHRSQVADTDNLMQIGLRTITIGTPTGEKELITNSIRSLFEVVISKHVWLPIVMISYIPTDKVSKKTNI